MAAQMVSSAVAQEAVNQILSRIKECYQDTSDAKENIERMEMAHIKLEAALETSNKWNVTSVPLLRWRSKLKRASQECDNTLRMCRQRLQEEEEVQQAVRNSSFPKRITHNAMSFVSLFFSHGNDDGLKGSTVAQRFERFAEGASEFLRYVELGGTPHRYMFSDPLIRHLITGKGTKYCFVSNGQHLSFLLQPFSSLQEHGMEVGLILLLEDTSAPENDFAFALNLRLSESTDIVRIAVGCLHLSIPYLGSTVEIVKTKLTQVPTQDLCWVSNGYPVFSHCVEHQNYLHTIWSKWIRPNPICCQQQDHHYSQSYNSKSSSSESLPCDIYLEPVIQVYLLGHVALSVGNNMQRPVADGESKTSPLLSEFPYLKLGVHFYPHAPYEDLSPGVEGSATEIINGAAVKHGLYAKICFEQLGDFMIPKAVDCLHESAAATSYQMLWKSKHGAAYLQVEKISWRLTTRRGMGGKHPKQRQGKKVQGWASANKDFLCSWVAHAPAHLHGTVMDWVQKEKRLPLPLLFKNNPCVDDCPIMLISSQYHRSLARKIKSCSMSNA
ncbi:unnamed protein product [Miscanthus lutarioriparius]|uniref:Uncharacterized protein n=1 Tax=Miscanthus lutarioriparius TaxID=422564 RepID=A0A811PZ37_9POAL|nr:unnamed protein product [Miscanthus lutarioriparius]